ncbi:MAG: PKD domain-containing protein, partial [Bacteroidota bacterium]
MKNLAFLFLLFMAQAQAQTPFGGHPGLYILGITNQPLPTADFSKTFVDGAALRVLWSSLETAPGVFNWTFLDGEVAKASAAGKKVSISVLGTPQWLKTLGAQEYKYIDINPNHPTFGDTLSDYVPWNPVFVSRVKNLNQALGQHFSANPTVSYLNSVAAFFSRNLPKDDILTPSGWQPIWQSFGYHADTIVAVMKQVLDTYMTAFPNTPQWNSMDYQIYEPAATGHARNYISQQFANYGLATYPSRFGVWREDLAGCNPPPNIQPTSQWYPVIQNPCKNGAQMLWNVQDGPARMNQCGILPNSKSVVIDSAINRGIAFGMRYMEVYKIDMEDATLTPVLTAAHTRLLEAVQAQCPTLPPPIAAFSADHTLACNTLSAQFFDQSTADTNAVRRWYFPGGSPAFSTAKNPVVTYSMAGVFAATLVVENIAGKDSLVKPAFIKVLPLASSTQQASLCAGETFLFNGQTLNAAGTFTANLTAANGCDSTVTLNLSVLPTKNSVQQASICAGETFLFNGQTLNAAGSFSANLSAANGCDSTVTLNLSVLPTKNSVQQASICAGETFLFNGQTLNAAGS